MGFPRLILTRPRYYSTNCSVARKRQEGHLQSAPHATVPVDLTVHQTFHSLPVHPRACRKSGQARHRVRHGLEVSLPHLTAHPQTVLTLPVFRHILRTMEIQRESPMGQEDLGSTTCAKQMSLRSWALTAHRYKAAPKGTLRKVKKSWTRRWPLLARRSARSEWLLPGQGTGVTFGSFGHRLTPLRVPGGGPYGHCFTSVWGHSRH